MNQVSATNAATRSKFANGASRAGNARRSHRGVAIPARPTLLITFYYLSFFITSFFTQQAVQGLALAYQEQHNAGSVVLAVAMGVFVFLAFMYVLTTRNANIAGFLGQPVVILLFALFLVQIASAQYATSKIGSLYHSLPAVTTLFIGACCFIYLRELGSGALAELSAFWHLVNRLQIAALALLLLSAVTDPSVGFSSVGSTILPVRLFGSWFSIHPNTSAFMAFVSLIHFVNRPQKTKFDWLSIGICGLVLILAQGRTEYAGLAIAGTVSFFLFPSTRAPLAVMGMLLLVVAGLNSEKFFEFIARGGSASSMSDMTGRTSLWKVALSFGSGHFLFGRGVWSAVRLDMAQIYSGMFYGNINNVDNTYLNTFLETGIVGATLVVLVVASLLWGTIRRFRGTSDPLSFEFLIVALALVVKSTTGVVITSYNPTQCYAIFIALFIIFASPRGFSAIPLRGALRLRPRRPA